jgi:predicted membrane protein
MKKQTVLGLLIIAAGVAVLLSNNNVGATRAIIEAWWPSALLITGAYMLWVNVRSYVWPLIVMGTGLVLLLKTLNIADVNISGLIFPVILLGVGVSVIVSARGSKKHIVQTNSNDNVAAIIGGSSSKNTSNDYLGGTIMALMGGVELDLSKATIKKEAVITATVVMGGLELRVADNVKIINRTQSLLGGVEDKTSPTGKTGPSLTIEGLVLMGGIEVKR